MDISVTLQPVRTWKCFLCHLAQLIFLQCVKPLDQQTRFKPRMRLHACCLGAHGYPKQSSKNSFNVLGRMNWSSQPCFISSAAMLQYRADTPIWVLNFKLLVHTFDDAYLCSSRDITSNDTMRMWTSILLQVNWKESCGRRREKRTVAPYKVGGFELRLATVYFDLWLFFISILTFPLVWMLIPVSFYTIL